MTIWMDSSEILGKICHREATGRIKMMDEVGMKEGDSRQFRDNPTAIAEHLTLALATDDLPTILAAIRRCVESAKCVGVVTVYGTPSRPAVQDFWWRN